VSDEAPDEEAFLREAIALAAEALEDDDGGPFGAVVVRDGRVVGRGRNRVLARHDPTAHAEVEALRDAAHTLGTHDLSGCALYASCEPCPMCLGAAQWARIDALVFAAGRADAEAIGFDDARFHGRLTFAVSQRGREEARAVMDRWASRTDRRLY
jgi:tRNA(Arg) A34 adenosine deaminase TadA